MDPREAIIDPTNITRDMQTLLMCFEGITGSGKSTLVSDIKKTCREIGRHHDLYIDRFAASLWVYGREEAECLDVEDMVKDRALYIYLTIRPEVAWARESEDKKKVYKISETTVIQTLANFDYYFKNICQLPVIVVNSENPINVLRLLEKIERVHNARLGGKIMNPFKSGEYSCTKVSV